MAINGVNAGAAAQISGAIQQAAKSTGVSFEYLLTTAQIESNLNPAAQAATSSAKGLYQFIEQTWLGTMKQTGAALGLGRYADAISQNSAGQYEVAAPTMRSTIMRLRGDPGVSANMAGALARTNSAQLTQALGRAPSEGELYIAHFLGPDGAAKLVNAAATRPSANASALFPQAAAANPGIFLNASGQPRSTSEVYAKLTGRFEVARAITFSPGLRGSTTPQAAAADIAVPDAAVPDTAGVTQAFAAASSGLPPLPDTKPLFQAMFTDRAQAVTATVNSLWSTPSGDDGDAAQPAGKAPGRLRNLFTDGPGDPRKLFDGA
jgi:hypothetical protein